MPLKRDINTIIAASHGSLSLANDAPSVGDCESCDAGLCGRKPALAGRCLHVGCRSTTLGVPFLLFLEARSCWQSHAQYARQRSTA